MLKEVARVMLAPPPLSPASAAPTAAAAATAALAALSAASAVVAAAPVVVAAAPAVVAAAPAVIAAAPIRGLKRNGFDSGATPRARKPSAAKVEAATRAFQNEGSDVESDDCQGYGDLLQKRAEMKKRRAAQK
jgi:hypothetical protein